MKWWLAAFVLLARGTFAEAQGISSAAAATYPPWEYALTGLATVFFGFTAIVLGGLIIGLVTASFMELGLRRMIQKWLVLRFFRGAGKRVIYSLERRPGLFDLHYTQLCAILASRVSSQLRLAAPEPEYAHHSTSDNRESPTNKREYSPSAASTSTSETIAMFLAEKSFLRPPHPNEVDNRALLDIALQEIDNLQALLGSWHDRIGFYLSAYLGFTALFSLTVYTANQMKLIRKEQINNVPEGLVIVGMIIGALAIAVIASLVLKAVEKRLGSK